MSKKVYHLKRSTHKEQYRHMKNMMEWKADLKEKQESEAERRALAMENRFIQVRDELKTLDPDGWSQWYDEQVPDWQGWINAQPAIECITRRVEELRAPVLAAPAIVSDAPERTTPAKIKQIHWRVASVSTLRNYAVAIKDFETVTNTKANQATFSSLRQWHDSMIGRKYAQNTIRARLSVVRLMSNSISYPLPPKQRVSIDLLSLKDVRAVLAQANKAEERQVLMSSLSGFNAVHKHLKDETDFMAHFMGIVHVTPVTAQALTRLLKRCGKKAGIDPTQISLRIWTQSGAWLLKVLSPVEFSKLMPQAEAEIQPKPLHGINRRSQIKAD